MSEVNQHILNIITPSGIDFTDTEANIGENYGKIYCVSKYPSSADYGWLAPLCNLEGTSTTMEWRYTNANAMIESMDNQIGELSANEKLEKKESERQAIQEKIKTIKDMINTIKIKADPVGYLNIMLHIQDSDRKKLEERIKRVSARVQVHGCGLRLLRYKQEQALDCISPYGLPNVEVSNMGDRIMQLKSYIGGFPMANSGINDEGGYYLGKTLTNQLVRLNIWKRGNDRVNSNVFVTGVPGIGKSTTVKNIYTMESAFKGTRLILFDPEQELIEFANDPDINGDIIDCTGGENGTINPLQVICRIPYIEKKDLDANEELDDFLEYDLSQKNSDLALHIQNLRIFFKMYFGGVKFEKVSSKLEMCLIELYKKHGIIWDTDIKKLKNNEFPLLGELYEIVEDKLEAKLSQYEENIFNELKDLLFPIAKGADQFIWNGYTNIKTKSKVIVFNTSTLLEADEKVKRAQFFNITTWAWGEMSKDRTEKVMLGLDEGYLYVDPELVDLMKFLRNISKRDRKYEAGLMFITHSISDVLGDEVKRYGQALIDNSCYKFIMGCDGQNMKETSELLKLTSEEEAILLAKKRGEGILFAGNVRVPIRIEVREKFLKMFGNAGGR